MKIIFKYCKPNRVFGRFGGGWNWKVGFQAGGPTLILSLLVCDLRIDLKEKA